MSRFGGIVVFAHVAAASWWFGALLLLRRACETLGGFILGVAAFNKFRISPTPAAGHGGSVPALRRSIRVEAMLVLGVLFATAWLTTFTSPHE